MSNPHQELTSLEENGFCKEMASPKQIALGKDNSNPLIVDSLLKTIWLSVHHVIAMKHWLFQSKWLLCVVTLQALIDRKKVVVTEDGIRHDLRLDDADGVECLPNEEIFTKLACMGYEKPPPKLTFLQGFLLCPMEILDTYSCSMYKCKEDCVERIQLFNSVYCHLPCNR
nr:hypothetical protein [Tanacetum cinerariifolium]